MKLSHKIALALLVTTSPVCSAQVAQFPSYPERLTGICGDIFAKTPDNSNVEEYSYAYERKVYEASGVDFKKDSAATARAKIQLLWDRYPERFQCSSVNFSQARGGILKYAVEMKNYSMIDNAIRTWRIDVNMIDGDGGTLLDFVKFKIEQNHGNANEPLLLTYYDRLRRYGAKHCIELPNANSCSQ